MTALWAVLVLLSPAFGQVTVQPATFTAILGDNSTFHCIPLSNTHIISIHWFVNGTIVENLNLDFEESFSSIGPGIGTVIFKNVSLNYNMTRIRCRVELEFEQSSASDEAILLIQGLLSAVSFPQVVVKNVTSIFTWTAPFTLDIPRVNPDITYCVDVVNSTSSSTLHSECGINVTDFKYSLPPASWCANFKFTVTPVNLAGNGTPSVVFHGGSEARSYLTRQTQVSATEYSLSMSTPVCTGGLTFVDSDTDEITSMKATVAESSITLTTTPLRISRFYDVTVVANNSAGSAISHTTISTHGIINVTITRSDHVEIVVVYSEQSNAMGSLIHLAFVDDGAINFTRTFLLILDRNTPTISLSLYPGQYIISVYDIEEDGTLSSGVNYPAVVREELQIGGNSHTDQPMVLFINLKNCNVTTTINLIKGECNYTTNSMAIGFQIIAVSSNISEAQKLYVNQTTNGQTSASVEVEESGQYLVSIIPILEGTGITGSRVEYREELIVDDTVHNATAGGRLYALLVLLLPTLLIAVLVAIIVLRHKKYFWDKFMDLGTVGYRKSSYDVAKIQGNNPDNIDISSTSNTDQALICTDDSGETLQ